MQCLLLENWRIVALHLGCYSRQNSSFLHRSRSIVILPQRKNWSRGEHNSSSIYIFNESQLKVVSWRVRVNVLFSDFYDSSCCCWFKLHVTGTLELQKPQESKPEGPSHFLRANGTIVALCSTKVETSLRSQKPLILESS